jgi:hypothetical protein
MRWKASRSVVGTQPARRSRHLISTERPLLPANDILRLSPVSILRRRHLSAMLRFLLLKLRETNMKTILSNQKGNIHHKDMSLHDFSVLACKEKHATP